VHPKFNAKMKIKSAARPVLTGIQGFPPAAQSSCQALHFADDAIMSDTEAFCAALGRAGARA